MIGSLRARLLLMVMAVLLPASIAAGVVLVEMFGNRLLRDLDVALEEEATTVLALLQESPDAAAVESLLRHVAEETDLGVGKRIVVRHGATLVGEAPAGSAALLAAHDPTLRIVTAIDGPPDEPLSVEIGVPATSALHATRRLTLLLATGLPIVLAALGAGLWIVMGRALRPLETAAAHVERIDAADLQTRVPLPASADEVGQMVGALNRMLDRVAASVAELQRFTADAAHELRTPLAVLRAGLEVALARERPAADYRAALTDALDETARIGAVAEDLLTLARLEALPATRRVGAVRVDEMLNELADAWTARATQDNIVLGVAAAATIEVDGTAADLYRLVANLVDNAIAHTPAGGRIDLAARAEDGHVAITVTDTGSGLGNEDLPRVFDRFYRGRGERSRGTGLGLSIARAIARAHGGDVVLTNRGTGGCEARVWLPLNSPGRTSFESAPS